MAVVEGQRTTGNIASSQRVIDMHEEILMPDMEPNAAPFNQIVRRLENGNRRRRADDPVFSWHEDALEDRFDAVNNGAGYAAGATAIVVDTATLFQSEMLVKVPRTGEVLSVDSVNTGTNTLTVTRSIGPAAAAALVDNDPLYIIGTAAEEGDTSKAARSENPVKKTNYLQIFKRSVEASATSRSSANESTPHDWRHQQKKGGVEHKKDIELAFLFGEPEDTTGADGGPRRMTGGVLHFATSNNQNAGGGLTETEVETFLRAGLFRGSKKKTLFASRLVISVLNSFAAGKLQTVVGEDTYGVKVMTWVSAHGEVNLVAHEALESDVYGGYAILVDFERGNVKYRFLNGENAPGGSRDTKLYENRQAPDRDGRKDEWITECGLQFGLPEVHGVLSGVTGAA